MHRGGGAWEGCMCMHGGAGGHACMHEGVGEHGGVTCVCA